MRLARSWLLLATMLPAFAARAQAPTGMTLDEFLTRQSSRIMAADTDGDGKVSRAEMAAAAKNGRDPSRRFDAMDANHDGYLDASEIRAALTRRFHRLDRNGDGLLTPDERMAGRSRASGAPAGQSPAGQSAAAGQSAPADPASDPRS